jgi:hypothetical protein
MMRISKLFTGLIFSLMFGTAMAAQGPFDDGAGSDPYGGFGGYYGGGQNGGFDDYYGNDDGLDDYYYGNGQSGGLDDYCNVGNDSNSDLNNCYCGSDSAACCQP